MQRWRFWIAVGVLGAVTGLAGQSARASRLELVEDLRIEEGVAPQATGASPGSVGAPPQSVPEENLRDLSLRPPWHPGTLAVQFGTQLLGFVGMGLITAAGGGALILAFPRSGGGVWGAYFLAMAMAGISAFLVPPLAAWLGGHWMRGAGTGWGVILGTLSAIGCALALSLIANLDEVFTLPWYLVSGLLLLAGPIVGYHISARGRAGPDAVMRQRSRPEARRRALALLDAIQRTPLAPASSRPALVRF